MRLSDLYQQLDGDGRRKLASDAGTDDGYLWQLATRWNGRKPSIGLIARLAAADERLTLADLAAEFTEVVRAE